MQNWILVFHLLGLVLWAGSLIALTRLMAWRAAQPANVASATGPLEKKLMFGGAHAGMGLTLITGFWMLIQQEWGPLIPSVSGAGFHIKLTVVFLLMVMTMIVQAKVIQHASGGDSGKASTFKLYHVIVLLLVIGALISVLVAYPHFKAKKAAQSAEKTEQATLVTPAPH